MVDQIEIAENSSVPFSRENLSWIIDVPTTQLNNWLARNQLWQTHRGVKFHRSYTIRELFDLAGFAAMRDAGIPERQCAQFVLNYGFYRKFLSEGGRADFSRHRGTWQIGVYDPRAIITLSINMRELGVILMSRLADRIVSTPASFPREAVNNFTAIYRAYVARGYLPSDSIEYFDVQP